MGRETTVAYTRMNIAVCIFCTEQKKHTIRKTGIQNGKCIIEMPDIRKSKENDQNIKFKMFFYAEIKKSIFFDLIRMELFKGRRKQVQDIITKCFFK